MKLSSFKDILDNVYTKGQKNLLSQQCYQYYIDKHSNLLKNTLKMLKFLSNTELTIQDVKDCIKYMPYNKIKSTQFQCHRIPIWSITTFKNEKIYKLFGLTMMILRWVGNDKIFIPFGIRPVLHRFTFTGYSFPGASKKIVGSTPSLIAMKKIMQYKQDDHRKYLLEKAKRGEKITVCLLAPRITDWLFSDIYNLLENSKEFQPVVVVMPFVFQGKEEMIRLMEQTYNKLSKDGYRVIKTYSAETDTYLDLRETLNPDVLFFTMYWQPHFHPNYYISNFIDKINFLTPYCIEIIRQKGLLNFELRNIVDRCFLPSFVHKKMSEAEMDNHGDNVYITGAPKLDPFFSKTYKPVDVWKKQTTKKKRVIWAPHHSDGFKADLYQFNAFYELAEFMLEIAEKYKDKIQFAFKPHPMLKVKVDHKWGKEIADAYYQKWNDLENCQLETGEFIDLFLTSDAMIFDSISFMTEYTATNKPSLFTIGKTSRVYLNEYGEENFKILYKNTGDVKDGIIEFLENVVLKGEDRLLDARTKFIQSYILPPGKKSAAQNIVDNIYEEIFGKRNGGAE